MTSNLPLADKRALVTGSSCGIGAEIARALARKGASVVVHGRGRQACNIRPRRDLRVRRQGRPRDWRPDERCRCRCNVPASDRGLWWIDILVNNAGGADVRPLTSLADIDIEGWDAAYRLNVLTALRMIKAAAPPMRQRGWGRLIQISSRSAIAASPAVAAYAAAKSALNSMTTSFGRTLAGTGVTCNAIMPGPVRSDVLLDRGEGGFSKSAGPGDVAAAVVYFASATGDFINGTTLLIDGGNAQALL